MNEIFNKLNELKEIKNDMKGELINKGVAPGDNLNNYSAVIRGMSGGITNTVSAGITPPDAE